MDFAIHPEAARLAAWDAPDADFNLFADRVARHPRFGPAVLSLSGTMLALAASDRALDGVFKDAGRYITAMLAIYLDGTGGLTLPRLKDICARTGYLSPGRARALLTYMAYLGYVELLPVARRGVPSRYVLTPRFVDSWRSHLRVGLEAAEIIEPAVGIVARVQDRPEVMTTVTRLHGETLFEATRAGHQASAFARVFLNRHAGAQFVHTLVSAELSGELLGREPERFSLAATSRRLGVSRIHLRRMLDDACASQLLAVDARGAVSVLAEGRQQIVYHYGIQLSRILAAVARTLKVHPEIVQDA